MAPVTKRKVFCFAILTVTETQTGNTGNDRSDLQQRLKAAEVGVGVIIQYAW